MSKRLREEVIKDIPASGGMLDLFDMQIYTFFNITSDEYDHLLERATDEELHTIVNVFREDVTLTDVKRAFGVRNKYIKYFQ